MRPDGFVSLDELLSKPSFRGVTQQQIEEVVSLLEKRKLPSGRYLSLLCLTCYRQTVGAPTQSIYRVAENSRQRFRANLWMD